jgi:large subunit ribosomal protein L22
MEARAVNRYIGSSPRKMRLVIDLIRGKSVDEALHILHFSPKHASKVAEKALRSAASNLQNKDESGRLEPEEMVVKEAFVDNSVTMKRVRPAPMGRAYRVRKRSNHVTIVVATREKTPPKRKKSRPASGAAVKATQKRQHAAETT